MKASDLEGWVLSILARIQSGGPLEDDRVELKREWPSAERAARQLAGHANASGGEQVLWIIGADEKEGVLGAEHRELADWSAQLRSHFESLAPTFSSLNVPFGKVEVVALLFDTGRVPFLVKNPTFNRPNGGPVQYEVPWREATAVRTARRQDLMQMLYPVQLLPDFEVLNGKLVFPFHPESDGRHEGTFSSELYISPARDEMVVIPFHRCEILIEVPGSSVAVRHLQFHTPHTRTYSSGRIQTGSLTMEANTDELVINGPGRAIVRSYFMIKGLPEPPFDRVMVTLNIRPVHSRSGAVVDIPLDAVVEAGAKALIWSTGHKRPLHL